LAGDTIYAASGDGRLIARQMDGGAVVWSARIATGRIEGANIVTTAGVVAVPVVFDTHAVDARTGQRLWTYAAPPDTVDGGRGDPGAVVMVHIAAADSTIFVPAWGGTIAALDARTGSLRWRWEPPRLPHRFGADGATVDGGTLYANVWDFLDARGAECEGRVVALDARTGLQRWQAVLPRRGAAVCLPGRPAVSGGIVAAQMLDGRMYGLDRATGALRWTVERDPLAPGAAFTSPITSVVVAPEGDMFFSDAGTGSLRAVAANSGEVLWRARFGDSQFKRDLTVSSGRIYAPDGSHLYVFDRGARRLLRTVKQPGDEFNGFFGASVAVSSRFAFATVRGSLWAFPH